MSQAELADRVRVSEQSVHNWEKGRNCPSADTLLLICRATGFELIIKERYTNGMYSTEPEDEGRRFR